MIPVWQVVLSIIVVMTAIIFCLVLVIINHKASLITNAIQASKARRYLVSHYILNEPNLKRFPPRVLLKEYVNLSEQTQITPEIKAKILADFRMMKLDQYYFGRLNSGSAFKRKQAAFFLGYMTDDTVKKALLRRIRKETVGNVKIYLLNALKHDIDDSNIDAIVQSLIGAKIFYRRRVHELIKTYRTEIEFPIERFQTRPEFEIKEMLVDLSEFYRNQAFHDYLKNELAKLEIRFTVNIVLPEFHNIPEFVLKKMRNRIVKILIEIYGEDIDVEKYLLAGDLELTKVAIDSLAAVPTAAHLQRLVKLLNGGKLDSYLSLAIAKNVSNLPDQFLRLMNLFNGAKEPFRRKALAVALATKMQYLVLKLKSDKKADIVKTIKELVSLGLNAELIEFLNQNTDAEMETTITAILKPMISGNPELYSELNDYLNAGTLLKLGIVKSKRPVPMREKSGPERKKVVWLRSLLIFSLALFPVIFILRYAVDIGSIPFELFLRRYIVDINVYLVAYYLVLNMIYLCLIVLSFFGARRQDELWHLKKKTMLFERSMLHSISVLAPAYNEELSIIDSVNSLLNLNYPDYELIVINDGSKDLTLQKLIQHFQLERKSIEHLETIPTRKIRGVYKNRFIPNLTVVDKDNGGKADALNCGINVAKNEYVCGIDADSLLEPEALLKLMSTTIDFDDKPIALGGNIVPANGCKIDHGQVETKRLPRTTLGRFQAIEYLRAFTSGRIGWSKLRCLLIVSGAFGLFDKKSLMDAGGYLTATGVWKKDTVGEDMELVVRLARQAHEGKVRHRIDYVYNANCYTEVPEDLKSLMRQRNRWHRGLIDILSYHRKLIGNPRYKAVGMLAMPYFFVFEMVGPLLEIQGLLVFGIGFVFGILDAAIVGMMFAVSVLFGIIVSLLSLIVTERESQYLTVRDTLTLVLYAIIENFGYRQLISIYRAISFFASMKENNVWGTVKRVGFTKK